MVFLVFPCGVYTRVANIRKAIIRAKMLALGGGLRHNGRMILAFKISVAVGFGLVILALL